MKLLQTLPLGVMLLTIAACGHPAVTAPTSAQAASAGVPTVKTAKGASYKLGFDSKLYKKKYAPKATFSHYPRRGELPAVVDNRGNCPPVYNQGMLGACTAFAMGKGLREYLQHTGGEDLVPLSALYLYYNERVLNNTVNEDSGATMTQGMQCLKDSGIAPDADDPYSWTYLFRYKSKPSGQAYTDAARWKVANSIQLPDGGLADIKAAVADKKPVVFGFVVYQTFMNQETQQTGNMVMPQPQQGEQPIGGHAVMVAGYDDKRQVLIMRNSWDTTWGDKGYFYMPYAFAQNTDWVQDVWTVN